MTGPVTAERYHALDGLRAFAMFLGVALHAGISFMVAVPAFWPVHDRHPVGLADVFLIGVHDFRMQLFFLLAGFFCCLLYGKYGLRGVVAHRLQRVALPFVLGLLFVVPTVVAVGLYAELDNVRSGAARSGPTPLRDTAARLLADNPDASNWRLMADQFTAGTGGEVAVPLVHLWFLYYLLIFVALVVVLSPLLSRLSGTRLLAAADAAFRWVVGGRWRVAIPAALTVPLMLPMTWIVDTPARWAPQWHVVGYYFAFFGFGWMLFRHRDLVPAFGRWWGPQLAVANLLVLPAMLGLVVTGAGIEKAGGNATGLKLGGFAAQALYTWLMITGLWGLFLRVLSRDRRWTRYLADSAYWCYLASITPTVAFQLVVRDWPVHAVAKWLLVVAATMAVLLASYEWCVRYTLIGAILNGRKYRAEKPKEPGEPPAPEPDPVAVEAATAETPGVSTPGRR